MKTTIEDRVWLRITRGEPDECWEWTGPVTGSGYGKIGHTTTHRVAWRSLNGPIPDGLFVLHSCDNKICCNPAHLRLGTAKDNAADRDSRGRHHSTPLLSRADKVAIHAMLKGGMNQCQVARFFGIDAGIVNLIANGKTYHLEGGKGARLTPCDNERLRKDALAGTSIDVLSKRYGQSPITIRHKLKEWRRSPQP